jgi:mercuric ion binding protein
MKKWMMTGAALLLVSPVWAAQQTVTLSVPDMTCATCPITVKKALMRVEGVTDVKSSLPKRETTVVFDDTRVKLEALTRATREAGFADAAVYGLALYAVGRAAALKMKAAHIAGWLQVVLALGALLEVVRRAVVGSEAGFSSWTTSVCIRLKPSNFLEKAQYLRMVLRLTLAVKKGIAFPDLHEVRS